MAQPIPLELPPRDPRNELHVRLQNAPMQHAEALLSGYEVIQGLQDSGVLDLLRGALGSGGKIVDELVKEANSPESVRAIRNFVILLKTMGSIDPEVLKAFAGAVPDALAGKALKDDPPGLFSLMIKFRNKNFRRGLAMVNAFLEGFGRNLSAEKYSGSKGNAPK